VAARISTRTVNRARGVAGVSTLFGAISLAASAAMAAPGGTPGPAPSSAAASGSPGQGSGQGSAGAASSNPSADQGGRAGGEAGPSGQPQGANAGQGNGHGNAQGNSQGAGQGNPQGTEQRNGQGNQGNGQGNSQGAGQPGQGAGRGSNQGQGGQAPHSGPSAGSGGQASAGSDASHNQGGGHGSQGHGSDGGQRPPGNNGTIKIEGGAYDGGMDNDPHVSCTLSVSFFGYDAGTQSATLDFTPVAPTRGGSTLSLSTSWQTAFRSGGNQLDTNYPVSGLDSALAGIAPAKQGYHISLTVHVTGSQGADVKHKVFWYQPCAAASVPAPATVAPTPPAPPPAPPSVPEVNSILAPPVGPTGASVLGLSLAGPVFRPSLTVAEGVNTRSSSTHRPKVAAISIAAASPAVPLTGTLPFTGAEVTTLSLLGLGLLGSGSALTAAARRRRA